MQAPDLGPSASGPKPRDEATRRRMQAMPSRDSRPELALRRELFRRGLRYQVHIGSLPGRPDVVFPRAQIAVFVDGCFWHGCPAHGRTPNVNQWYWSPKLKRNIERDRDTDRRLTEAGWAVFRVWEHEEMARAADLIESAVRSRTRHK